ncbi:hypothetical protein LCGC14_1822670 [marine sediment metagenome]|uniref:Terminase large subunit gp17-like C-terminal domain-containing protein n=1 Tax=marine sediment metagenome TaxID=412755 RepID=A0A0F9IY62_9ZZZZ
MPLKLPRNLFRELNKGDDDSLILDNIIPNNLIDFMEQYQPMIGRKLRSFDLSPFWVEPLLDNHPNIMFVNGRQTYKTTNSGSMIAHAALQHDGCEVTYVADDEEHKGAFSEQRLRNEVFLSNNKLRPYLPGGKAAVGRIRILNGSVVYLVTDENKYHKVEGKSNKILILDETQAQDVGFLPIAMYSLSATKGKFRAFGIGGEAGSDYYKMWMRTDQREWFYDDKFWREKLTFDGIGTITNTPDELKNILAGKWIPQAPANINYRGYHFPQTIFAAIPLTILDAVEKYQTQPELSIEYQKKHYPLSMYLSHTMGEFYKAERRPITPEMVERCYIRYIPLLKPAEVKLFKQIYQNEVRILGGVDFGSGPAASQTVASIILRFRKSNRYLLAHIDPRPQEHPADQSRYLAELFSNYGVEFAVGDWGYGQDQIRFIQDGGRDSKDQKFAGIGRKFVGCRTHGDETRPELDSSQKTDEKGIEYASLQVDKTTIIQNFVNFVGQTVSHPIHHKNLKTNKTVFMIPSLHDWETDFLLDDMTSITRKDLEAVQEVKVEDPRQRARKEFNHPPDSVMSIIYCLIADQNYDESAFKITPAKKRR